MARIKRITENAETGWSDWIYPVMSNYRMVCCDCGLAHDLQFQVFREGPSDKANCFTILPSAKNQRVQFRARRNVRSTAQVRRKPPQR